MTLYSFHQEQPQIDPTAFIAPTAAVIGRVTVGSGSSIWYGCTVRGDVEQITIGARTNIQDGTVVHVTGPDIPTHIGDEVTIGHKAIIHACTLQDRSFVGMGAIVMDRAVVETGAMVGAGALVPMGKIVKSGELWLGSPARSARVLTPEESAWIEQSAAMYTTLGAEHRRERQT